MKKRRNKIIPISLALILIVTIAIFATKPLDTKTIPSKFETGTNPGFDLTLGELNFGKIIPGSSSSRTLTITNTYPTPTLTKIESSGQIQPYIIVSQNNILLQPSQSTNITLTAMPPEDLRIKEYIGKIIIKTHKA